MPCRSACVVSSHARGDSANSALVPQRMDHHGDRACSIGPRKHLLKCGSSLNLLSFDNEKSGTSCWRRLAGIDRSVEAVRGSESVSPLPVIQAFLRFGTHEPTYRDLTLSLRSKLYAAMVITLLL